MKLDSRNPSTVVAAALLAFALSGCGQEPPPKQDAPPAGGTRSKGD